MKLILYWILALGCASAFCGEFACRVRAERFDGQQTNKGTAAAISAHTLVTAAHVVTDAEDVYIENELGWLRCRVVKVDVETDLAIIECKAVDLKFLPLDTSARRAGESVTLWSSVLGAKIKAIAGHLRRLWDATPRARWLCDAPKYDHGGSGSPVIADGKLIGVATALQADKYGLPVPNTAIMVPAAFVQWLVDGAPVILPDTKAEVVELPKTGGTGAAAVSQPEQATNPAVRTSQIPLSITQITGPSQKAVCTSGQCRAAVQRERHWDSDADGHGQGGWIAD